MRFFPVFVRCLHADVIYLIVDLRYKLHNPSTNFSVSVRILFRALGVGLSWLLGTK